VFSAGLFIELACVVPYKELPLRNNGILAAISIYELFKVLADPRIVT